MGATTTTLKWYTVVTPPYEHLGRGEYPPIDPPEWVRDYVAVQARTKREALVKAVKAFRDLGSPWMKDQDTNRVSPFTGLKAEALLEEETE